MVILPLRTFPRLVAGGNTLDKKLILKGFLAFWLVVIAAFGVGYFSISYFYADQEGQKGIWQEEHTPSDPTGLSKHGRFNILLLGTDARPGEKDARTDTMIVASVDRETRRIALLSIPRDSLVEIPGHGKDKINSANLYGGIETTKGLVEDVLGIQIKYWAKTNFNGFKDIIDTLGGVTIDVEKNMRYRDPTDGTNINLRKGVQRLDGKNALDYARFRHDALGDITRTQRQQKLLRALGDELFQSSSIVKLPKLVPQILKAVETNLTLRESLDLVAFTKDLETIEIVTQTLPGKFYNNRGSYWQIDEEKAKLVLNDLLLGITTNAIQGEVTVVDRRDSSTKSSNRPKGTNTPIKVPTKPTTPPTTENGNKPNDGSNGVEVPNGGNLPPTGTEVPPITGDPGQSPGDTPGTSPGGVNPGTTPGTNPGGTTTNPVNPGSGVNPQNPAPGGNGSTGNTGGSTTTPSNPANPGGGTTPAQPPANPVNPAPTQPATGAATGNGTTGSGTKASSGTTTGTGAIQESTITPPSNTGATPQS